MKDFFIEILFDIPTIVMLIEFFSKKTKIIRSILDSIVFVCLFTAVIVFTDYDTECLFSIIKVLLILIFSIIQWKINKLISKNN